MKTSLSLLAAALAVPSLAAAQDTVSREFAEGIAPPEVATTIGTNAPIRLLKTKQDLADARADLLTDLTDWDLHHYMYALVVDQPTPGPARLKLEVEQETVSAGSFPVSFSYLEGKILRQISVSPPSQRKIRPFALVRLPRSDQFIIPRITTTPADHSGLYDTASGLVRVSGIQGNPAVWLVNGTKQTRIRSARFAKSLVKFQGQPVVVGGRRHFDEVTGTILIDPVRREITGTATQASTGLFMIETPATSAGKKRYAALGPGKKLLEKLEGHRVTADAYVFDHDLGAQNLRAYIAGLRAKVTEESAITWRNRVVYRIHPGHPVTVTQLYPDGVRVRVVPDRRAPQGAMPFSKLNFGPKITGLNTTGITGHLAAPGN